MSLILSFAKSATTVAMMLFASNTVRAEEDRYDRAIEAAMIERAQEKIGELRPTIDYDKQVQIVTRSDIQRSISSRESLLPQNSWVPPKPKNALPPMVDIMLDGVDTTFTASTPPKEPEFQRQMIWDKFDTDGNPIK